MTRIFRNIRKQLASENKVMAYLRYAIGEIFLVVIGILIALQVNTWNENRKDKILEHKYLVSISNDLDELINYTNSTFVDRFDKKIKDLYLAKEYAEGKIKVKDTLDFLHSVSYGAVGFGGFEITGKDTYQELISSGNLIIISNDKIRKSLIDLYSKVASYKEVISTFASDYAPFVDSYRPFNQSNPDFISKYDQRKMMKAFKTETFWKLSNHELTYAYRTQMYSKELVKLAKDSKQQITNELKTKF